MSRTSPRPLDYNRVRELFDYDEHTGLLQWKVRASNRISIGDYVKPSKKPGYVHVGVDGENRLAHHVVWVWNYGSMPDGDVDHINRVRSDNRLANLRCSSRSENILNSERTSVLGRPGVIRTPGGKFAVGIHVNRIRTYVGTYPTLEQAAEAYENKHVELYGTKSRFHPDHPNPK